MKSHIRTLAIVMASLMFSAGLSFAKKPDSPGNSEKNKSEKHQDDKSLASDESQSYQSYFNEDRQSLIRNYYSTDRATGRCPPGLAKKNNGCQPPGQAKKWRKGQPLPADVVYYDLPAALLHELGRTPKGEKIVRVGADLLLLSIGTGMVIDALEGLDDIF